MSQIQEQCRYYLTDRKRQCTRRALPGSHFCWQHHPRFLWSLGGTVTFLFFLISLLADLKGLGISLPLIENRSPAIATAPLAFPASTNPPTTNSMQVSSKPSTAITTPGNTTNRDVALLRDEVGAEYVFVPAGPFLMGSHEEDTVAFDDEKPQHEVDLPGFWIMRTEVTNAQYAHCVAAAIGRCDPPVNDFWNQPEFAEHPVTHVNWEQARAYAQWVNGRLPTEAEWEKACRGLDNRIYPWGTYGPNSDRLNFDGNVGAPTKVGSYPEGASPYGALDMAGNVWEWTADWYGGEYYAQSPDNSPPGPEEGNRRTLRGGQWDNNERWVRCANRYRRDPFDGAGYGFRVVRSE